MVTGNWDKHKKVVLDLSKSDAPIDKQINSFIILTNSSRATFFRLRKELGFGWKRPEETKDNEQIVLDLNKSSLDLNKQFLSFYEKTKKSKAVFQRIRKKLGLIRPTTFIDDKEKCYFCGLESDKNIIHHIDMNKKDNTKENLIPLCRSCHFKIHKMYRKILNKDLKIDLFSCDKEIILNQLKDIIIQYQEIVKNIEKLKIE